MPRGRYPVLSIVTFPVLLTIGIITIPVVTDYSNHAPAEQAVRLTARWFSGHIIAAMAFGLGVLAACSIGHFLRLHEQGLAKAALPLVAVGTALYAAGLGADGVGPIAFLTSGGTPRTFFDGSGLWVTSVFVAATVTYGVGLFFQVIGLIRSEVLTGAQRPIAFTSALVFMVAPAIPSGWALYGVAAAAFGVYIPVGLAISRRPPTGAG